MPEHYKEGIRSAFRAYCPDISVSADAFYAVVYYFHRVPSQQDADNISKPRFLEMLDNEEHILYVELGRLSFKQIRFGYEVGREV